MSSSPKVETEIADVQEYVTQLEDIVMHRSMPGVDIVKLNAEIDKRMHVLNQHLKQIVRREQLPGVVKVMYRCMLMRLLMKPEEPFSVSERQSIPGMILARQRRYSRVGMTSERHMEAWASNWREVVKEDVPLAKNVTGEDVLIAARYAPEPTKSYLLIGFELIFGVYPANWKKASPELKSKVLNKASEPGMERSSTVIRRPSSEHHEHNTKKVKRADEKSDGENTTPRASTGVKSLSTARPTYSMTSNPDPNSYRKSMPAKPHCTSDTYGQAEPQRRSKSKKVLPVTEGTSRTANEGTTFIERLKRSAGLVPPQLTTGTDTQQDKFPRARLSVLGTEHGSTKPAVRSRPGGLRHHRSFEPHSRSVTKTSENNRLSTLETPLRQFHTVRERKNHWERLLSS